MGFIRDLTVSVLLLAATCKPFVGARVIDIIAARGESTKSPAIDAREDASSLVERQAAAYWYEGIAHQGISAFGPSGYTVYRNVKDFGAKGDGVTDDTAAIQNAIASGGRCGQGCSSTTTTPAVVYFPAGTYLISAPIFDYYYTQLVGNPNNVPTLLAAANFNGGSMVDADPYFTSTQNWGSTNVFYRQVRNFIFDMRQVPATTGITGIHWPTAQATSLQNVVFQMSAAAGTQHVGLFGENGSAGFLGDLTFNGGRVGLSIGSQQYTVRNIIFNNCATAISMDFNWAWLYQGLSINNCGVGIDISNGGPSSPAVGSITVIDSSFTNVKVGIITVYEPSNTTPTAGSLILENIALNNVPSVVMVSGGATVLTGTTGTSTITAWGEGHEYTPTGPKSFQGAFTPPTRPGSLVSGNAYYTRSKPQYNTLPVSSFKSVRSAGATGNGVTDDTTALQNIINSATAAGQVVYFDSGTYRITSTLTIPAGAKIVGETYPIIMSSGSFFNNMNSPQPVVRVGTAGSTGQVEWSDMIVSTQGAQAGATLIEWNLATSGAPSGMWDVHTRIGGFAGSNLQVAQCPTTGPVNTACIGAYMSMHITPSASGLYMENNWLWTADHDIESASNTQVSIYSGRGLYIESTAGTFWLFGTAVEHHTLYQYQLANTQNIFMGFIQTETPYYQPVPTAPTPFTVVASLNDPNFAVSCAGVSGNCAMAWGLRIVSSKNILVYGAGHYSFFDNYSTTCSNRNGLQSPEDCQVNIVSLEGTLSNINIYDLYTIGATNMITENGVSLALYSDDVNTYGDNIALFQLSAGSGGTPPPPPSSTSSVPTTPVTSTGSGPAPTGWNFLGCYLDNVGGRTLGYGLTVPGGAQALTVEICQSGCANLGYVYAGVEYSGECYCGNAILFGGTPAPDGNAQCKMTCNGNTAEICGGPNRLDLYGHGISNSTSSSPPPVTTTSSAALPASTGWNFRGCYSDNVGGRALGYGLPVPGGATALTVEICQTGCHNLGYLYAGVEYSDECYCGNTLANGGAPAPDGNAQCTMTCDGNKAEICGGPNRLDLYSYGVSNSSTGSTAPSNTVGKRGLSYNTNNPGGNAEYANLFTSYPKVTWGYDWGYPSYGLASAFEFVPMLWGGPGGGADPGWTAAVQTAGTKHAMSFNEPDVTYSGSSNMLPAAAASAYQQYMQPFASQVSIGGPNILWNNYDSYSSGGNYNSRVWTQYFKGNCTGCTYDFFGLHYYQDCEPAGYAAGTGVQWFQTNVTNMYSALGVPIWVTEFQCYGTDAQQITWLQSVLPWLDSQSYVQRYAYFGVFEKYLLDAAGDGLSDIGLAYATT